VNIIAETDKMTNEVDLEKEQLEKLAYLLVLVIDKNQIEIVD